MEEKQQHPTLEHNGLTRNERLTLKELASNHDLIINKANKGSKIVIKDRSDYVEEGIQHLSDENTYLSLDRDHTAEVTKFVKHTARPQEGRSTVTKIGKLLYATDQCQNCHHILSEKDTQKSNGHQTHSLNGELRHGQPGGIPGEPEKTRIHNIHRQMYSDT